MTSLNDHYRTLLGLNDDWAIRLFPKLPEILFEVVGDGQRTVQLQCFIEALPFRSFLSLSKFSGFIISSQRVPLSTFFCNRSVASR